MDNVICKGSEASLVDCRHNTLDDCDSEKGAGIICKPGIICVGELVLIFSVAYY